MKPIEDSYNQEEISERVNKVWNMYFENRGVKKKKVAEDLGITESAFSLHSTGNRLSANFIVYTGKVFGIGLNYLFLGENEQEEISSFEKKLLEKNIHHL